MTYKPLIIDRVPLAHAEWEYIDKRSLDAYRTKDWEVILPQRQQYYQEQQAAQVLRMLRCQENDRSYGYTVNNYYHCLQTATFMFRDGLPEEDVVVGLLHDIGFIVSPITHGEFAAALMQPYTSEKNLWMLKNHAIFQQYHCYELNGCDRNEREKWRGHPHFEWTATFVDKYDQITINHDNDFLPIEVFEPMVQRFFESPRFPHQIE